MPLPSAVQGLGPLTLPLTPEGAAALATVSQPAPYGRGSATVVDPAVRRCAQLEPGQLSLRNEAAWAAELGRVVVAAAKGLGLPPQAVQVGAGAVTARSAQTFIQSLDGGKRSARCGAAAGGRAGRARLWRTAS